MDPASGNRQGVELNLRLVSYLVAVVDEGHFGRAAARLFISPPALSQQVRKLERTLGVELLDRSTHPIRPTSAGELFLVEARAALTSAERAVAAVRTYRQERAATVRVGFMSAIVGPRTRALLDEAQRRLPQVSIELVELAWPEQASAVRDGHTDASVVRPPFPSEPDLRFDVLWEEPRVVALPLGHRLAQHDPPSSSLSSTASRTSAMTRSIRRGCTGGHAIRVRAVFPSGTARPCGP